MKDADYRRKTQEVAEERRKLEEMKNWTRTEEDQAVDQYLKKWTEENGVLTQAQLDSKLAAQRQELEFERFIDNNPAMGQFKDALKTLWKGSDKAWEDLAVEYGFSTSDKLSKAKGSRDVKWNLRKDEVTPKSVADMNPEEYAARKASVPKGEKWVAKKTI